MPLLLASAQAAGAAKPMIPVYGPPTLAQWRATQARAAETCPASAMSALAQAARWQKAALRGDLAATLHVESALRHAVSTAPKWIEARRAMARWTSARRQWTAASAAWSEVLALRPADREARAELQRTARLCLALPQYAMLGSTRMVRMGASLNDTDSLITVRSHAATPPVEAPELPAFTIEQLPAGLAVQDVTDNSDELVLPAAPAGVSVAARATLARALRLASLSEANPDVADWAAQEFEKAIVLAPKWAQLRREKALWHTARGQWRQAKGEWRAVLAIEPADVAARTGFLTACRLSETIPLANLNLVTIGHDSDNQAAREFSTAILAAQPQLGRRIFLATQPRLAQSLAVASPAKPLGVPTAANSTVSAKPAVTVVNQGVRVTKLPFIVPSRMMTHAQVAPALAEKPAEPKLVPVAPVKPGAVTLPAPAPLPAPAAALLESLSPPVNPTPPVQPTPRILPEAPKFTVKPPMLPAIKLMSKPAAKPTAAPSAKSPAKAPVKKVKSTAKQLAAWPFVEKAGKAMKVKQFSVALDNYQKANALDPANQYAARGVADAQMILKRYPDAIAAYQRFLAIRPGDARALRGLADCYAFSSKYADSARVNAQLLKANPKDFQSALQAAQVSSWSKKYAEAGRFYRAALAVQPKNALVWIEYAEVLSYAKDPLARETFGRAMQLDPESQRAMLGLANLLSWTGEFAGAVPLYRGILVREPDHLNAQLGLGDALTFSSQSALAVAVYRQALRQSPQSVQARLGLGRALAISKQNEEAMAILTALVKEQPDNTEALEMLGIAQIADQPGASLTTFQTLLKLQTEPKGQAMTLTNIGDLQMKLGKADEARASFAAALNLVPGDARIALSAARALMRQELYADADPLLAMVLEKDPNNVSALLLQATSSARADQKDRAAALTRRVEALPILGGDDSLGLFYALHSSGEKANAARLLARLTQAEAERPGDALKVANAVRDSGQEEASFDLYKKVIEADPANSEARLELTEALLRRKEFDAAQIEVNAVLTREPGNIAAKVLSATLSLRRDRSEGSFQSAEIIYKEALAKDPANMPARLGMGELMSTRSKFLEAALAYREGVEADPDNLGARLGLARNLYYSKQVPESIKEYQTLVQRAPDNTTVKLELAQVYLDRNMLDDAQKLFSDILKSANYPFPGGPPQLGRFVPGIGEAVVKPTTFKALRAFADLTQG